MRLIDADELLTKLDRLEAVKGHAIYRKALNDALHDFFPQIIADMPTLDPPPNEPLTLEELREMDGEPVRVSWAGHSSEGWALVRVWSKPDGVIYLTYNNGVTDLVGFILDNGAKIYRRKPEEVSNP